MKVLNKLIEILKNIFFMPRNLSIITRQSNNLIRLENKLETLNQKLNDLDIESISKKLDALSQNQTNGVKIKTVLFLKWIVENMFVVQNPHFTIGKSFINRFLPSQTMEHSKIMR